MLQNYVPILIFLGVAGLLGSVLIGLGFYLGPLRPDKEKLSAYECGIGRVEEMDVRIRGISRGRCECLLACGTGSAYPFDVPQRAEQVETGALDLRRHGRSGSSSLVPPADSANRVVNPLSAFRSGSAQRRVFVVGG